MRSGDWSPLAGSDPTPGSVEEVSDLARRYRSTADEIRRQSEHLTRLAASTGDGWDADAGRAFAGAARELAGRLGKAHDRYATAAEVLDGWTAPLSDAQRTVDGAAADARAAKATMAATAPGPPPAADAPPPTPEQEHAEDLRAAAHARAADAYAEACRRFDAAVDDYRSTSERLARRLREVIDHDGVHDSWWDRHVTAHLDGIKKALKVLGYVVTALAVVALVISLFVPGLNVLVAGVALTALLETAAAVGTGALLLGHGALAVTGQGSWLDVGLDVVALATFGIGRAASSAVSATARGAEGVAATEAASRASSAVEAANAGSVRFWGAVDRVPLLRTLLGAPGRLQGVADEAAAAGRAARTGIETLPAVTTTLRGRLVAGGAEMAELLAEVQRLDDLVPHLPALEEAVEAAARGVRVTRSLTYGGFLLDGLAHLGEDVPPHLTEGLSRWATHPLVRLP